MFETLRISEDWLLHSALAGGLILLVGAASMLIVRQPVRRQRIGEFSLLGSLLVAALCALPAWLPVSVPILDGIAANEPPEPVEDENAPPSAPLRAVLIPVRIFRVPADDAPQAESVVPPPSVVSRVEEPPPVVATAVSWSPNIRWGITLYPCIVGGLLVRFLIGYLALWRWLKSSQPPCGHVQRLFNDLVRDWKRPPRLRICRRLAWPLSFGIVRPTILLPARFCPLGGEGRGEASDPLRWILIHELTHLQRRDAVGCLLMALAQCVYFYLPWLWWLRRQVRLCQEYLADAAAAAVASSEDYAQYLVTLASSEQWPVISDQKKLRSLLPTAHCPLSTSLFGGSSTLFRRITMLLNSKRPVERTVPRGWTICAASGFFALAVLFSGVRLYADDENPKETKEKAARQAAKEKLEAELKRIMLTEIEVKRMLMQLEKEREQAEQQRETLFFFKAFQEGNAKTDPFAGFREDIKKVEEALEKAKNNSPGHIAEAQKYLREAVKKVDQVNEKLKPLSWELYPEAKGLKTTIADIDMVNLNFVTAASQRRPRLGIHTEPPGELLANQLDLPKGVGLVIIKVEPNLPAAKAGMKIHDILVELDGKPVPNSPEKLADIVKAIKPDAKTAAIILRKGQKVPIKDIILAGPGEQATQLQMMSPRGNAIWMPHDSLLQFTDPTVNSHWVIDRSASMGADTTDVITYFYWKKNNRFSLQHREGKAYSLREYGSVGDDGKVKMETFVLQIGDSKDESHYNSIDKVPEKYRDKAKSLIEMVEKGYAKTRPK